ncbi:MAG: aldo/keto reductase [Candidatus Poribacteria bacterium]|nr:aldo/keto reductase [Candidatus Poribacteria bacterium]
MEYRQFGNTGMRLSAVGLGGLLAHYEGVCGHPPPDEKRQIYLRAAELGVNLFDMGYGDEVHIPVELKGARENRYFSLKVGAPQPAELEGVVEKHLRNIRRDAIDILRVHHYAYMESDQLAEQISLLKQTGKVQSLCLIRHFRADQGAYVERGPEPEADADLVIYNYVCRWQAPGIERSAKAGKGVLIMKALGSQWLSWADKTQTDWTQATKETIVKLSPRGEGMRSDLELAYPIIAGPWHELAEPGEDIPRTNRAVRWVLENQAVSSILVAFASVAELEEALV